MRRVRFGAALGVACLAACASPYSPAEKETSFAPYVDVRLAGAPLAAYLRPRTALLLRAIRVAAVTLEDGTLRVQAEQTPGAPGSLGTAVPLTRDGYYLTAAHCVREGASPPARDVILVVTDGRDVRHAPARVAWISEHGDLALLRSSAAPFDVLPWHEGGLEPGLRVAAAGFPLVLSATDRPATGAYTGPSAGRLLGAGKAAPDHAELHHDAPLNSGDSGGPLLTLDGRLIGVNTRIAGGFLTRGPSIALRPDPAALAARIEADRRAAR